MSAFLWYFTVLSGAFVFCVRNDPLLDTKLFVLEGNEKPEMCILWLKEYIGKTYLQDDLLRQSNKYNTLLELIKNNFMILTRVEFS